VTILERAKNYLAKIPPAVSGAGGHDQTLIAAFALVEGFALSIADAKPLMLEYSARCQPPWTEREIDHKLSEADRLKDPAKIGKLAKSVSWPFSGHVQTVARVEPPAMVSHAPTSERSQTKKYAVPDTAELPDPLQHAARKLLQVAFRRGEWIGIAIARTGNDGREVPKGAGTTLTREKWLEKLEQHSGNPNGFLRSAEHNGIYIRINPLNNGGSKDKHVTDFRHALLEFDAIDLVEQWSIIVQSKVPCAAVLTSGGKSVHAWVKVNAESRTEYDARVKMLYDHFAAYEPDEKNKNPSRFSRLAGCERGTSRQELLAVDIGAKSFLDWADSVGARSTNELPPIRNAAELLADETVVLPPEVIHGVLYQGQKCILGSSSKARKTWILLLMALCVATGKAFWKWPTTKGRVLYINFEIHEAFIKSRLQRLAKAMGVSDISGVDVWNLRGHAASLGHLLPDLIKSIGAGKYAVIIIDPIYKGLGGRDENSAGDISELCNELERLAVATGAAVVFACHYSKGNQAGKSALDRIGGSGVFGRDADTVLCLTAHNFPDAFTVDLILRNYPEQDPFVVAWEYPLMTVREDLNPHELKPAIAPKQKPKPTQEQFISIFKSDPGNPRSCLLTAGEMRAAFRSRGWDELYAPAMRDETEGAGTLKVYHGQHNRKLAGLPDMVEAFSKQQTEAGSILAEVPLSAKPKCKKPKT